MCYGSVKEKFSDTKYLKSVFLKYSDGKYKTFHASLVPDLNRFYGVRIPDLRKIAKEICKENTHEFLKKKLFTELFVPLQNLKTKSEKHISKSLYQ